MIVQHNESGFVDSVITTDRDAWEAKISLAYVNVAVLRKLRIIQQANGSHPSTVKDNDEWMYILGQIINAFDIIIADEGDERDTPEMTTGLALYAKHYNSFWD